MTSKPGSQTIAIHILINISRRKTIRQCGQLIEYNIKVFLQKLYTKCGRETIVRSFSKKSRFSISLDQ